MPDSAIIYKVKNCHKFVKCDDLRNIIVYDIIIYLFFYRERRELNGKTEQHHIKCK